MKLYELNDLIYSVAPKETQADYDNTGIMIGDPNAEITGVLTTLDATVAAVNKCKEKGFNVLLTHHPLFFSDVKSIMPTDRIGAVATEAIKNGIAVVSHHTNLDVSPVGLNTYFAKKLGGKNVQPIAEGAVFEIGTSLGELANNIAEKFFTSVRVCGKLDKTIEKAFVSTGACGRDKDALHFAMENVDVFITGEMKHNFAYDCKELSLIEISHYASERICGEVFKNILSDTGLTVEHFDEPPYVEVNFKN